MFDVFDISTEELLKGVLEGLSIVFLNKTVIIFLVFVVLINILKITIKIIKKNKIKKRIKLLTTEVEEISPEEYFKLRNKKINGEHSRYSNNFNFAGVYILHNKDKDLFYVGQSVKVLDRVGNHFLGRGNGDVYADYKYGDTFSIRMISLESTEYKTLDQLELHAIDYFQAYTKGYNKNKGNKTKRQG